MTDITSASRGVNPPPKEKTMKTAVKPDELSTRLPRAAANLCLVDVT
jgi:hypothetical protein